VPELVDAPLDAEERGIIPLGPLHEYVIEPGITGDGFAHAGPITGPIPNGSYLRGVYDCLGILNEVLGLYDDGPEANALALVYKRIGQELI
jgi:hypothetical protein